MLALHGPDTVCGDLATGTGATSEAAPAVQWQVGDRLSITPGHEDGVMVVSIHCWTHNILFNAANL